MDTTGVYCEALAGYMHPKESPVVLRSTGALQNFNENHRLASSQTTQGIHHHSYRRKITLSKKHNSGLQNHWENTGHRTRDSDTER